MLAMAALVLSLCGGCSFSPRSVPDPDFPDSKQVQLLEVRDDINPGRVPARKIFDRATIAKVIDDVHNLSGRWQHVDGTFPTAISTIIIVGADGHHICDIDFGLTWVSSDCGQQSRGYPPLATMSRPEAQLFLDSIGFQGGKQGSE